MKRLVLLGFLTAFAPAFAFEDEPDELNWDTLGGGTVGFAHFCSFCETNTDFAARLLALPPLDPPSESEPVTFRILPDAFTAAPVKMWWKVEDFEGERALTCSAGHDAVSGATRIGFDIPKTGLYRIWARYWHEQGGHSSFGFELSDGRFADATDFSLRSIEDGFHYRFDFAEYQRRTNAPPTRINLPTGWIWESTPLVRLEKGRRALTVSGIIHEGPYKPRRIAEFVLTEDPLFLPDGSTPAGTQARELWRRRPRVGAVDPAYRALWRQWRKSFLADLADGRLPGVDAGRLAFGTFYDEESNLVGTPRAVADEKARTRHFFATLDRTRFLKKIEGEDFTPVTPGWELEYIVGTSNGRIIRAPYGAGACDAVADFEVPSNGTYTVWTRFMETGDFLAPFTLFIEDREGNRLAETTFLADNPDGHPYGGWIWRKLPVDLPVTAARLRLYRIDNGKAYRRVDAFIITDRTDYTPEGEGTVVAPLDASHPLTVWRLRDLWYGYTRLTAPQADDDLAPLTLDLRAGEVESLQLLVRNNTKELLEATPRITGDAAAFIRWRVPGWIRSAGGDWCAMPLFERDDLFVPPEETVGVWLTVDGRAPSFADGTAEIAIGGSVFRLTVRRRDALPEETPVPLVLGWASPENRVSSWEMFRDIGINVIGETAVPKADAARYGIRLNVRFNDATVEADHVREVVDRYRALGYDYGDWAWSFMDEPPAQDVDHWLELAWKMEELDPSVRVWVNPGEGSIDYPPACLNMVGEADLYCPAIQHYATDGWRNQIYNDILHRQDPDVTFDTLMTYSTPCFAEKAPSAPTDLLGLGEFAAQVPLDGWGFFALAYGFPYCNSVWDEENAYYGDQCMNLYPGAGGRTLSTRNAEAIRESIRRYRRIRAGVEE